VSTAANPTRPGRARPPRARLDWAIFLDIDGTLVDVAPTPHGVHIDTRLGEWLRALAAHSESAVALISGRAIADVDRLFAPLRLPVAGQHGVERRDAKGGLHRHAFPTEPLERLRERVHALPGEMHGLAIEDKGLSVALHYRCAPELAGPLRARLAAWVDEVAPDICLHPGKMVFEIKPAGRDKGTAIREFMAEPPFSGRIPAFIGDDVTDEYGLETVNALGGVSVKVGPGPSAARWRLGGVAAVRRWLEALLPVSPGGGGR